MIATLFSLLKNRSGATAIEYGMIVALIAILLISSLAPMGLAVETMFEDFNAGFDGIAP
jgi:Flp pilus assembly pilin Flp